jgi:oligopeptide transport system substrate-binding protein
MRRYRFVLAILAALLLPSLAFSYSITMRATVNPDSLDPQIMYNSALNFIERALFVSLVDFDEVNAVPIPDLAKSWDVSADGKTWTFHLRNDVKWTNGRAVTARDVEYSVKRLLDPATASGIAPKLYPVVGAKDYNTGVTKDASKVAVKALDDWNVQFQLTDPLAFFAAQVRLAGFPVPKEAIDKNGTSWYEQGKIVSNGPYTLKEFKPHDRLVLQKNPNYYDAKNVQIDTVTEIGRAHV